MARKYYTCTNCGFIFTRTGDCDHCPDCGKKMVREATPDEIEELNNREKEEE